MSHYFKRLAARSRINQVGGMQGEAPVRVTTITTGGIDRTVNPGAGGNLEIHQEAVTVSGPAIPTASVNTGNSAVSEHLESMPGVTGAILGGVDKVKPGSFEVTGSSAQEVSVAKTASTDRKLAASPVDESATGLRGEQNPSRSRAEASSLAADVRPSVNETESGSQVRPIAFELYTDPTPVAAVVIRDSPRAGTAAAGSKGNANHAIVATAKEPRVQPRNPTTASKGIEIKIGKIDMEIHQAAASKKPVSSQPRTRQMASESAAPGNNLSRYYLRGGYG